MQNIACLVTIEIFEIESREIVRLVEKKLGGKIKLINPARKFLKYGQLWKRSKYGDDQLFTFFVTPFGTELFLSYYTLSILS